MTDVQLRAGLAYHLGVNVRRLRRERGWTQRQLGAKAGLTESMVSVIERRIGCTSLFHLYRLAAVLRVEATQLLPSVVELCETIRIQAEE